MKNASYILFPFKYVSIYRPVRTAAHPVSTHETEDGIQVSLRLVNKVSWKASVQSRSAPVLTESPASRSTSSALHNAHTL